MLVSSSPTPGRLEVCEGEGASEVRGDRPREGIREAEKSERGIRRFRFFSGFGARRGGRVHEEGGGHGEMLRQGSEDRGWGFGGSGEDVYEEVESLGIWVRRKLARR